MQKYVYFFGGGKAEGKGDMKDLLGGKGAGLAEMTNAGVPVPPGFTISTEVCKTYYENKNKLGEDIQTQIDEALGRLEAATEQKLGSTDRPLLVSVRSGAKFSMPGMMDTILNLGLNDTTVKAMAARSGNDAIRLGQLSPIHSDVRQRRVAGRASTTSTRSSTTSKNKAGAKLDTDIPVDVAPGNRAASTRLS